MGGFPMRMSTQPPNGWRQRLKGRSFTGVIALGVIPVTWRSSDEAGNRRARRWRDACVVSARFSSRPEGLHDCRARRQGDGACARRRGRWTWRSGARCRSWRGPRHRCCGSGHGPDGEVMPPGCRQSPLCGKPLGGTPRQSLQRVQWKQTMGYTFDYPYVTAARHSAVCRRWRSIRKEPLGLSARGLRESRSSSSSIRTTS